MLYPGHKNRVPYLSLVFEVLCTVRYEHCEIIADIKYSLARVLLKCKNHLILPTDQSKSPKKTDKTLSWDNRKYTYVVVFFRSGVEEDCLPYL